MTDKKEMSIEDKIKLHKKEHGTIYDIQLDGKYCLLKQPNRDTYEDALALMAGAAMGGKTKMVTAGLRVLQGCWIDGDKEIFTDDTLLIPFAMQAVKLCEVKAAVLKKN